MAETPIRFYFDYVSPYAYLASTQIWTMAARHSRAVEVVPVLFAGMLGASGAKGPAEIPAKREYMYRDVNRLAKQLGVPIEPPATHPFNPLLALRATHAAPSRETVEKLYRAVWAESKRIDDAAIVAALLGEDVVAKANDADVKSKLRTATDDAIAAGVFGVPTFIVDGEMFWGVDSLPLLERFLDGETIAPGVVERWQAIRPSATRR
jgi:2-hydroxychromene-2-carboxylate isomerase